MSPTPSRDAVRPASRGELEQGDVALAEALERGQVLTFERGMLPLPPDGDLAFLRDELPERLGLKNISYHPEGDYLTGFKGRGPARDRTHGILRAHAEATAAFTARALPGYARGWRRGKVNFRPLEEQGRALSRHSSNELVHVDAFASGATHGGRILRVFTNVHPTQPRDWVTSGGFPALFAEFGVAAGLADSPLAERAPDRARSGLLRGLARLGLPHAMSVDSSPYDRAMKRMHDHLKDDDAFQNDAARKVPLRFEPFTSWAVLTDTVSHAVVSGRHALVATFVVDLADCALPELAPYHILARGRDRAGEAVAARPT